MTVCDAYLTWLSCLFGHASTTGGNNSLSAAKFALATHSKSLLKEASPKGIRDVRVSPGWVGAETSIALAERLADDANTNSAGGKQIIMDPLGGIPIDRPSKPGEVANLIAHLASSKSATITGTEDMIDGGRIPVA